MKNRIFRVKNKKICLADIEAILGQCCEVSAAYLFGSAALDKSVVNDLDILVLLKQNVDEHAVYIDLIHKLASHLNLPKIILICCFSITKKRILLS